jgi:hypothetical protein
MTTVSTLSLANRRETVFYRQLGNPGKLPGGCLADYEIKSKSPGHP